MRSLIVDDDAMGRLMLASFLEELGPCVGSAARRSLFGRSSIQGFR